MRAIDAVGDLATAHARAGTDPEFAGLVDDLLRRDFPAELRGHLRHLRGEHLLATRPAAESARDPARTNLLRFTMAESYLRIGWLETALPEYESLVDALRRLGDTRTPMYRSAMATLENLRVAMAEQRQHGEPSPSS